ncbi:MAG: class I SAM-dependent methyltransferase [Armatimonadia bacterium]
MKINDPLAGTYSEILRRLKTFPDEATARRYFRRNYLPLLQDLPEGLLLDIGCGLGDFLHFCRTELGREVCGLDLVAENVACCRELGLEVEQADATEYLQRERPYAAVVMNDVLEHIEKPQVVPLLGLIHSRLAPGGRLLIKVPNMSNLVTGTRTRYMDLTHVTGYTDETLRQVLETAGFDEVDTRPVDLYVTGNPVLNVLARAACGLQYASWRLQYRLNGVPRVRVLTKSIIACGIKAR